MLVISKPLCRVNGCSEPLEHAQLLCDRHWSRVDSKTKTRLFEALADALDEAARVRELAYI